MALIGAVCFLSGCTAPRQVLGKAPDTGSIRTIAASRDDKGPVTLHGTMIEKCPTAACWFRLQDKTGVAKVDVKGAYFSVAEVPVNADVTVSGTWRNDDGVLTLAATGMSY